MEIKEFSKYVQWIKIAGWIISKHLLLNLKMLIPCCMFHFELEASLSLGHNKLHIVYNSDQCCSGICSHFLQIEFVIFKGRHHETNFISKLFACQRKQCVIAFIKELWCMNPLMSWWSWITSHYRCVVMLGLHSH